MIKSLDGILLSSEDSQKLADFYKEKVGLKCSMEFEMGDKGEKGFYFESVKLYINQHSEVHGKSKEPERYILNLETEDIEKTVENLDKEGVKKIKDTYHVEGYGLVATYEDIDGNYFQVVQVKSS
ncbi:MAG: VOC family protein [Patescibacteria group bacterium]